MNEIESIIKELMIHDPNMRRFDVEQRVNSISYALELPLSKGATWALDNGSYLIRHKNWWQATIHDTFHGRITYKYDRSLAVAICKVWLAWKKSTGE